MGTNEDYKRELDRKGKEETWRAHRRTVEYADQQTAAELKKIREQGKKPGDGCFVATAAFGDYGAPEVVFLSAFRDRVLIQSRLGRAFVRSYYKVSPPFAALIANSTWLRLLVRSLVLRPIIFVLRSFRASRSRNGSDLR